MPEYGDDAGRCANGLSAQRFRAASAEERAIHRRWVIGMIMFYGTIVLVSGVAAIVSDSTSDLARLTTVLARSPASSARAN